MGELSCPSAHKASPTPCVVFRIAGCELRSVPRLVLRFLSFASAAECDGGLGHRVREVGVTVTWGGSSYREDCSQDCRSLLARSEWDPTGLGMKGRSKTR